MFTVTIYISGSGETSVILLSIKTNLNYCLFRPHNIATQQSDIRPMYWRGHTSLMTALNDLTAHYFCHMWKYKVFFLSVFLDMEKLKTPIALAPLVSTFTTNAIDVWYAFVARCTPYGRIAYFGPRVHSGESGGRVVVVGWGGARIRLESDRPWRLFKRTFSAQCPRDS